MMSQQKTALTNRIVQKLQLMGYKSFVCLGCPPGDDNEDYMLVPSKFQIDPATPDKNMVDDHALVNFGSDELKDMIAGDEFIRFMVQLPTNFYLP